MSVLILSARHRELAGYCNACNRNTGKQRYAAAIQHTVDGRAHVFKLCRPCLREAARIAGGNAR